METQNEKTYLKVDNLIDKTKNLGKEAGEILEVVVDNVRKSDFFKKNGRFFR